MLTEQEPSSTRLINLPIQLSNGTKCKLLIYTNDLKAPKKALMIVPIPNPTDKFENFGFIDISSKENKAFRTSLVDACKQFTLVPQAKSLSRGLFSVDSIKAAPLKVHDIGNYKLTLAPTLHDLNTRIDWSQFEKPHDFNQRFKTLHNKRLYPHNCAYVVAEAHKSVKDDGFGVIYPDPGFTYFPTAHEEGDPLSAVAPSAPSAPEPSSLFTQPFASTSTLFDISASSEPSSMFMHPLAETVPKHMYDVQLYDCFAPQQTTTDFNGVNKMKTHNLRNPDTLLRIFSKLSPNYTNTVSGKTDTFRIDNRYTNVNFTPVKGYYDNCNVRLNPVVTK